MSTTASAQPLRVYRDMGDSMELHGEWLGNAKRNGGGRRRRRKGAKGAPAPSTPLGGGSSFLPELVDAVNELDPHPFREDAALSKTQRRNAPASSSVSESRSPEGDVWSAYAELQSAYSALQASELSASTHLKQSAGLLEKERKRVYIVFGTFPLRI